MTNLGLMLLDVLVYLQHILGIYDAVTIYILRNSFDSLN